MLLFYYNIIGDFKMQDKINAQEYADRMNAKRDVFSHEPRYTVINDEIDEKELAGFVEITTEIETKETEI
jgi:hypothetical protein